MGIRSSYEDGDVGGSYGMQHGMGSDIHGAGGKKPKLGSGKRFENLTKELSSKGAENPKALAAYIGRKKYGGKKMAKLSAGGKKHGMQMGASGYGMSHGLRHDYDDDDDYDDDHSHEGY